ncbi:hypothetical protein D3C77_293650 [compost metagenome]
MIIEHRLIFPRIALSRFPAYSRKPGRFPIKYSKSFLVPHVGYGMEDCFNNKLLVIHASRETGDIRLGLVNDIAMIIPVFISVGVSSLHYNDLLAISRH